MRSIGLAVRALLATSFAAACAAAGASLCPLPEPPLVWDHQVRQPPALAEPAARVPFRDPVFGTCTVRLTDRTRDIAADDDSAGLKNEYSRVQSWNADESRILIRGIAATWYLYDAATLAPLGRLPFDGSVDPRWDATDPNILYFQDGTQMMRLDVRQSSPTLVRDFADDFPGQTLAFVWSRYEGSPSMDGRLWGFMTQTPDDHRTALLIYDLPANRILAQRDLRGFPTADTIDSVSISPLGTYLSAFFDPCDAGTLGTDASPCGLMVYDQTFHSGRGLLRSIGHADYALDVQGREVIVYQDNDTDHISMVDLASGTVTDLLSIDFSQEAIGLHFSGRGFRRPGWAVVSTHDSTPDSLTWMDDEVFLVELVAGGRTLRVAHTHSVVDPNMEQDYWAEPHASANRDLTKVLFTTNWGRIGTGAVETMLVELPDGWAGDANARYVAPGGSDSGDGSAGSPWATIQHAASAAQPGETVYIRGGTYREKVRVTRSGSASAWLSFAAYPGEAPVLDASGIALGGGELEGAFYILDAAYVRVSGLTVRHAGPGNQDCGFLVEDSQHVFLEKNVTDDTASSGIGVWGSADVTLDGNEVIHACHGGIQEQVSVGGTTGFALTGNRVHDAGGTAIGGEGICLKDGSSGGRVHGNSVWNVPEKVGIYVDAWDKHTFDIELDGNLVHDCIDGIGLASEMGGLLEAIRVTNNVAYGNSQRGLFVGDYGGVTTHPMNDLLIENNTFVGNGTTGWGGGIAVDSREARNVVVRNNVVSDHPSFTIIVSTSLPAGAVAVDHNLIDGFRDDLAEGETRGTDFVEGDPRFVSAAARDYRLAADSPAIDKGSSLRAPAADYDGVSRPQGGGIDIGAFERPSVCCASTSTLFVPVVLRTTGLAGSFFTSEMTLTNRGEGSATVTLAYTGTDGVTGSATETLGARRQLVIPDAIAWLRTKGVPIPASGSAVGTLRATFTGLADARDGAFLVRTTTPVPPDAPTGAAGLSYAGVRLADLPAGPVLLGGLRSDAHDRSNVAVQNAGGAADGSVTLRIALVSGGASAGSTALSQDVTLSFGGFFQLAAPEGFSGTARVERLSGSAPFYAYGVINDGANSDGSFVAPIPLASLGGSAGITLPVVVETSVFSTEVILANTTGGSKRVRMTLHAGALGSAGAAMTLDVPAGAQRSIPGFVAALRASGASIPTPIVGPLEVTVDGGSTSGLFVAARTGNDGGGGRYTLFYPGVPAGSASSGPVWLNGLQQTAATRTNLAIVNTGETDGSTDSFLVELFDGSTGTKAGETTLTVGAKRQAQIDGVLTQLAPGTTNAYARVTRTSGVNPFIAYAVLNDGANPGERSGDGAWISSD